MLGHRIRAYFEHTGFVKVPMDLKAGVNSFANDLGSSTTGFMIEIPKVQVFSSYLKSDQTNQNCQQFSNSSILS